MTVLVKLIPVTRVYSSEFYDPIRVLWVQVLKRALFDFVILRNATKLKDKRDFVSARQWLFSPHIGLVDACKVFGWPLEKLRNRAKAMTRSDVRKMEFRERDLPKPKVSELEESVISDGHSQ